MDKLRQTKLSWINFYSSLKIKLSLNETLASLDLVAPTQRKGFELFTYNSIILELFVDVISPFLEPESLFFCIQPNIQSPNKQTNSDCFLASDLLCHSFENEEHLVYSRY